MTPDTWIRDVIAHINAVNANGAAEPTDDDPADDEPEHCAPAVDCLVCFGDDPECPYPHGEELPDREQAARELMRLLADDDPPSIDDLAAYYGVADSTEVDG